MKPAISNIALPAYKHEDELRRLRDIGFSGLEVATSRVWLESDKLTFPQVESYRHQVEQAGLKCFFCILNRDFSVFHVMGHHGNIHLHLGNGSVARI